MATTVIVNIDPKEMEHYTGYVTDPIDDNDVDELENEELNSDAKYEFMNSNDELRSSGMAYMDNISFSEKSCTLEILEKMISKSNTVKNECAKTILMPHSRNPKNEYTDLTLLPAAFPILFPYGIGGHEDRFHSQHIPFKRYVNHLLRLHDPRFRHHRSFIFMVFDILQRREIATGTYLMTKQMTFERSAKIISHLTPHDVDWRSNKNIVNNQ